MTWNDAKEAIERYKTHGIDPGQFLVAVLSDSLYDAVVRADDHSLRHLGVIVDLVFRTLPREAYGSRTRVAEWMKAKQPAVKQLSEVAKPYL
jgi:hypothetical protein